MKTERRHELATNELADWIGTTIRSASQYGRAVLATVGLIGALFIAYAYMARESAKRESAAWERYLTAVTDLERTDNVINLEDMAKEYSDTEAAQWARLKVADVQLEQGISQLFTAVAAANDTLRLAEINYNGVLQDSTEAPLQQRATMGLAQTYESLNQLDDARKNYEEITTRWPNTSIAETARQRLEKLDASETKAFYDWLAQHEPAGVEGPGTPGSALNFDNPSLLPESGNGLSLFDSQGDSEKEATIGESAGSAVEGTSAAEGVSAVEGASIGERAATPEIKSSSEDASAGNEEGNGPSLEPGLPGEDSSTTGGEGEAPPQP